MGFLRKFLFLLDFHFFYKAKAGLFLVMLFSPAVQAVKIYFPDEELATESVLPNVDIPAVVLNRNITLKWRLELDLNFGWGLDEPFYNPNYPNAQLTINITEVHSVSLLGIYYFPSLSSAGRSLKQGKGLSDGKTFDPSKAPYPQMSAFLNYRYRPLYGKISLSKVLNLNLSIYAFVGPGVIVSNQNDRFPAFNLGIGQNLYLTKWLGLRSDLGVQAYYGPSTALLDLGDSVRNVRYSDLQADQKGLNSTIIFNFGLIFLL